MAHVNNNHLRNTTEEDPIIKYNVNYAKTGGGGGLVDDGRYAGPIEKADFVKTKSGDAHNVKLTVRTAAPDAQAGVSIINDFVIEDQNWIDSLMASIHSGFGAEALEQAKNAGDLEMRASKLVGKMVFFETKTEANNKTGQPHSKIANFILKGDFEEKPGPFAPGRRPASSATDLGGGKSASSSATGNGAGTPPPATKPKTSDSFGLLV